VTYNGGVYIVKAFDANGYISGKLPTNATYWVQASKDIFRAMDTALIDGANIAGFTFKNNVMQSQTGTLTLDGVNGEITALAGHIGDWEISNGEMTVSGTYQGGTFNNSYTNTLGMTGMKVSVSEGLISTSFGVNGMYINKESSTYFSALTIKNSQSLAVRRTDPVCGVYIEGNKKDIGIFSNGPSHYFMPASGGCTNIHGLRLNTKTVLSSTSLDLNDDIIIVKSGTATLPEPSICPGKIYFIKIFGGKVSVPNMAGAHSNSTSFSDGTLESSKPRILFSATAGTGSYCWVECYCGWD
jgi:hypothetical protein